MDGIKANNVVQIAIMQDYELLLQLIAKAEYRISNTYVRCEHPPDYQYQGVL